jgi:hypothetical protein
MRQHTPGVGGQGVQAGVGGDPVQPGPEAGTALELLAAAPGPQHGLLDQVLGVLEGAEHPVAVHLQLPPVPLGQRGEGGLVARRGRGHDRLLLDPIRAGLHLAHVVVSAQS